MIYEVEYEVLRDGKQKLNHIKYVRATPATIRQEAEKAQQETIPFLEKEGSSKIKSYTPLTEEQVIGLINNFARG